MTGLPLIIFDCDGVLVDSEAMSNKVLTAHLQAAGVAIDEAQAHAIFCGCSAAMCLEKIAGWLGAAAASALWLAMQKETFTALAHVKAIPGVKAVLNQLQNNHQSFCVASAGDYEKMAITLGASGIQSAYSPRLFSAVDVAHSKPAPDLFLHAAAHMGFLPSRCIVVEDSLLGVQAALAAGMRVCWYVAPVGSLPDHNVALDLSIKERLLAHPAVSIFSHMGELPRLLKEQQGERV